MCWCAYLLMRCPERSRRVLIFCSWIKRCHCTFYELICWCVSLSVVDGWWFDNLMVWWLLFLSNKSVTAFKLKVKSWKLKVEGDALSEGCWWLFQSNKSVTAFKCTDLLMCWCAGDCSRVTKVWLLLIWWFDDSCLELVERWWWVFLSRTMWLRLSGKCSSERNYLYLCLLSSHRASEFSASPKLCVQKKLVICHT